MMWRLYACKGTAWRKGHVPYLAGWVRTVWRGEPARRVVFARCVVRVQRRNGRGFHSLSSCGNFRANHFFGEDSWFHAILGFTLGFTPTILGFTIVKDHFLYV